MPDARNTVQRQLVLDAVHALTHHPTADEIYQHIHNRHATVSRGTVYRNLNLLAQRGDVRRVSHLNAADRFDFNTAQHYHFICTSCGQVHDAPLDFNPDLLEQLAPPEGFAYHGFEITFKGLCPQCVSQYGS